MKKKGFTLIELLAVIVVLAVVALITVPVILNVIDKVRKESYRDSVYGIMESGKIYLASHIDSISAKDEIIFTCDGSKCTSTKGELSFKGSVPESGNIYISGNGLIEIESLYNGKYYANGSSEEGIEITTEDSTMTKVELTEAVKVLNKELDILKNKINTLENENNTIKNTTTSIDEVYPVGSIYITLSDVNPSTLFPGTTWESYGKGKTLIGADGSTYKAGTTGGSSTVTLTTSNIPTLSVIGSTTEKDVKSGNNNITPSASFTGSESDVSDWKGSHDHNIDVFAKDSGIQKNNLTNLWVRGGESVATTYGLSQPNRSTTITVSGQTVTPKGSVSLSNTIHQHSISIPSLTVNASYTNNSQTSINIQNPYTVVYMWKRVS